MVAIFTGSGSGAARGSGAMLGKSGLLGSTTLGRSGEQVLLNAANGNLMLQQRDEMLVGRGADAVIARTYNSLGDLSDDNHDNWRLGVQRRLKPLTGTANTAGSSVVRVMDDGTETLYSYDGIRVNGRRSINPGPLRQRCRPGRRRRYGSCIGPVAASRDPSRRPVPGRRGVRW